MSLALLVGMIVALAIIVAGVLATAGSCGFNRPARIVRWIALALVIGIVVALAPEAPDEAGWFAVALFGVPVVACAFALLADYAVRWAAAATWLAAGVMIAWSLVTGLGWRLYFLVPSLVMLVAAVLATSQRHADVPAP